MDAVIAKHGKIDILVLCAGIIARTPLGDSTDDEWDAIMNVNVRGVVSPTRKLSADVSAGLRQDSGGGLDHEERRRGIGPGLRGLESAVHGMMRWIAKAGAPHGVYANTLAPGPVETAIAEQRHRQRRALGQQHRAARSLRQCAGHRTGGTVPLFSSIELDHRHVARYQRRHVDELSAVAQQSTMPGDKP